MASQALVLLVKVPSLLTAACVHYSWLAWEAAVRDKRAGKRSRSRLSIRDWVVVGRRDEALGLLRFVKVQVFCLRCRPIGCWTLVI